MDERLEVNRRRWDEAAVLHRRTYFLPDEVVRDAELAPFMVDELGDLSGLRVCHLQCHIGGDSLSLARLGASMVVGVDFSAVSLETARARAVEAGLADRVTFVEVSVDDAPTATGGGFDVVHTSGGVLCWMPSIDAWASSVHDLLRPGGWLHLAEMHPYACAARWGCAYGGGVEVYADRPGGYSDPDAAFENSADYEWRWGLGDIVTALAGAGMHIDWLHEQPAVGWNLTDEVTVRREDGLWEVPGSDLPLGFSLRATRP